MNNKSKLSFKKSQLIQNNLSQQLIFEQKYKNIITNIINQFTNIIDINLNSNSLIFNSNNLNSTTIIDQILTKLEILCSNLDNSNIKMRNSKNIIRNYFIKLIKINNNILILQNIIFKNNIDLNNILKLDLDNNNKFNKLKIFYNNNLNTNNNIDIITIIFLDKFFKTINYNNKN